MGISWEAIIKLTDMEVTVIMGVQMAYNQKENEEQIRQAAASKMSSMNKGML